MEHVSTLCAISTLGIAATGFAFGRVDRSPSKPSRSRKRDVPLHDQYAAATDIPVSPISNWIRPALHRPLATAAAEPPLEAEVSKGGQDELSNTTQPEVSKHSRKPSFAGIRLRRRGQTLAGPPLLANGSPSTASQSIRRPSSSWVRRFSFQPEKRSSCQSHICVSPNGPSSPVSPRASTQRMFHKLVRRPLSQHADIEPSLATAPSTPVTVCFHRPATSYQQVEKVGHKATHSLNLESNLVMCSPIISENAIAPSEVHAWRPYISATLDGLSERVARRFSTATKPRDQGLRRIVPDSDYVPALILATSITARQPATTSSPIASNPGSPVRFRDPFNSANSAAQSPEDHIPPERADCGSVSLALDTDPRGLSTSSIFAFNFKSTDHRSGVFSKRRAISTPLPFGMNTEGTILLSNKRRGRRNITDPAVFSRPSPTPQTAIPMSLMTNMLGTRHRALPSYFPDFRFDMTHLQDVGARPLTSDAVPLSRFQHSIRQRPKRHSIATSELASTILGSDETNVFTSGDEDETDFLSDTAFDSIRTHVTTNSNQALYAPRIETIFDAPSVGSRGGNTLKSARSDICPSSVLHYLSGPDCDLDAAPNNMPSPVPTVPRDLHEDESNISFPSDLTDDEDARSLLAALPSETVGPVCQARTSLNNQYHLNNIHLARTSTTTVQLEPPVLSGSRSLHHEVFDTSLKMNIFDWSEQPKSDREGTGTDGRPRTVHGKHTPGSRGSRAHGRKAPSTLHLRSQSVPVTREPTSNSEQRQASGSKFGTWGLGTKGVSEDWDSDFDFEDSEEVSATEPIESSKNIPRRSMVVPPAILERQASLHGQFGQVQELTMLVEELKRLRHQGSFLNLVRGPSCELWKEAEGIVNLATLDDDDRNDSPPGSPSSLTFSFDESEGDPSNSNDPWKPVSGGSWGLSFSDNTKTRPTTAPSQDCRDAPTKRNSVLDLIYQQRNANGSPHTNPHLSRCKKLPFDTQSLRDLVVRAGVVTRALKEEIRRADGVTTEPSDEYPSDPPFSRMFNRTYNGNATLRTPSG
ncbi:uncharacterized protein BP01DRAFT_368696 [Aspergillus saccharolyticus JOP 1030-1]|uniref:Uncharacterized protein n=1 Tax=Aspergillus saccharolyticus JOP 1030-1 TaxID=1450539 RepID=A0A318Z471_9EURO|nr:hypothetical protein BP01DRAFT_368696 [Aspergillus saccharolyticus JOP 1030-1]PYH41809.1 hypothetical protein BP01DRAFT_368696 [Aspergillus saccharolyticus JOP 1030-1]